MSEKLVLFRHDDWTKHEGLRVGTEFTVIETLPNGFHLLKEVNALSAWGEHLPMNPSLFMSPGEYKEYRKVREEERRSMENEMAKMGLALAMNYVAKRLLEIRKSFSRWL